MAETQGNEHAAPITAPAQHGSAPPASTPAGPISGMASAMGNAAFARSVSPAAARPPAPVSPSLPDAFGQALARAVAARTPTSTGGRRGDALGGDEQRREEMIGDREQLVRARGDERLLQYWAEIRRAVEAFEPWAADRIREMPQAPRPNEVEQWIGRGISAGLGQVPGAGRFLSLGFETLLERHQEQVEANYAAQHAAAAAAAARVTAQVRRGSDGAVSRSRSGFHQRLANDSVQDESVRRQLTEGGDAQIDAVLRHYGLLPVADANLFDQVLRTMMREFMRWRADYLHDARHRSAGERVAAEEQDWRGQEVRAAETAAGRQADAAVRQHGRVDSRVSGTEAAPEAGASAGGRRPDRATGEQRQEEVIAERERVARSRGDTRLLEQWSEIRRAVEAWEPWARDRVNEMRTPPGRNIALRVVNWCIGEALGELPGHTGSVVSTAWDRVELPERVEAHDNRPATEARAAAHREIAQVVARMRDSSTESLERARTSFHRRLADDAIRNDGVRANLQRQGDEALEAVLAHYGLRPAAQMNVFASVMRSLMRHFLRWRAEYIEDHLHRDAVGRAQAEAGDYRGRSLREADAAANAQADAAIRQHGDVGTANR